MLKELDLADEMTAYLRQKDGLIEAKSEPWVLFADGCFQRAFADYDSAVSFALDHGFVGRFLVRNLYAPPAYVPFVFKKRA
jgi:hypothetical protein